MVFGWFRMGTDELCKSLLVTLQDQQHMGADRDQDLRPHSRPSGLDPAFLTSSPVLVRLNVN